jgi:hypothetical protein
MLKPKKRVVGALALLLVGIAMPAMVGRLARAADAPPEIPA